MNQDYPLFPGRSSITDSETNKILFDTQIPSSGNHSSTADSHPPEIDLTVEIKPKPSTVEEIFDKLKFTPPPPLFECSIAQIGVFDEYYNRINFEAVSFTQSFNEAPANPTNVSIYEACSFYSFWLQMLKSKNELLDARMDCINASLVLATGRPIPTYRFSRDQKELFEKYLNRPKTSSRFDVPKFVDALNRVKLPVWRDLTEREALTFYLFALDIIHFKHYDRLKVVAERKGVITAWARHYILDSPSSSTSFS